MIRTNALLICLLTANTAIASVEPSLFSSVQYRSTDWYSSGQGGFEIDTNVYKSLDFTISANDKFSAGLILDLDDNENEVTRYSAQLGFGKYGAIVEKGQVNGQFVFEDYYDIQNSGRFSSEYKFYAIYKGKHSKSGIGYVEYTFPVQSEVNYGLLEQVEFVDPEAEVKIFGYFFGTDSLRKMMQWNGSRSKWAFDTFGVIGFMTVTPSDIKNAAILSACSNACKVTSETFNMLGSVSSFRYGYNMSINQQSFKLGFSIGGEIRLHGSMLDLSDSNSDNVIIPYATSQILYGPYVRVAGNW